MSMKLYCIDSNTTLGGHRGLFERLEKNNAPSSKHIFLVPDRYTLGVEKEICESCFSEGTFSVDTFSFTRLAVKGLGNAVKNCLSKEGTVLLLHRAIGECSEKLVYYKNIRSVSFARELFAAIASLRSGGITPEIIREKLSLFEGATADKLTDIALLYERYLTLLSDRFDTVTRVELLEKKLAEIPWICDSHIYVLGFNVYSDLQMRVIKKLIEVCPSVSISFCKGMGGSNVFCYPSDQRNSLIDWCKERGVPVVYENREESLSEPFRSLQREMFGFGKTKDVLTEEQKNRVRCYSAENPYEEVKNACREIRHLVFEEDYRYKDIAVSCNDEKYLPILRTVFARFGIPCFTDEKFSMQRCFVARFVFSALQAVCSEYALADVIECLRSPLSGVTFEETRTLENYCIKYNISYTGLLSPFTFGDCEEAEKVRKKGIEIIKKVPQSETSIDKYCDFILEIAGSEEMAKLSERCSETGTNAILAYSDVESIQSVAEEIKRLCEGQTASPAEFRELLASTLEGMSISLLPQYVDCVFIGNTSDSRFSDVKALFVLGANEGNFPVQTSDPLIISCLDSELMRQKGLPVYPVPAEANLFEKFAVIDLCSKPERLYVGYSLTGLSGEKKEKGEGVKEILSKLFIQEKPLYSYYDFSEEERLLYLLSCPENAYYDYVSGKVPEEYALTVKEYLAAKGYAVDGRSGEEGCRPVEGYRKKGDGYAVSVTMLERYFCCPYSHFLSDVLKIKPKDEGRLRANEKGNLVHAVFEDFFRANVKDIKAGKNVSEGMERSIEKVFSGAEYERFFTDPLSAYEMRRLKKECREALTVLAENVRHSRFTPTFFEVRFGGEEIKMTAEGKNFYFSGVVDRADISGKDIVIIDYKTGSYDPSYEKIYSGEKLQLFVYLKHFLGKGYHPAAVLYQPIHDGYNDKGRSYAGEGQVRADLDTYFRLDDRMIKEEDGVYESDTLFIPCKYKGGEVTFPRNRKYLIAEKDFEEISNYAFRVSEQAISDIINGDTEKNPIEGNCDRCPYNKMCGEREERKRQSVNKESFYRGEEDGDQVE